MNAGHSDSSMRGSSVAGERRKGDTVEVPGDYQARALTVGPVIQRFWHGQKLHLLQTVCPPRPDSRVLDAGCGSGVVANFLAACAQSVDAVDSNPAAIEFARANAPGPNVRFHLGLVDEIGPELGPFDRIYCMEVIEHIGGRQIRTMFRRFRDLLAPAGRLLVTTPDYASFWPAIEWVMDHLHLAPRMRGDQHVTRLTAPRLVRLLRAARLEVLEVGRFCGLAPFLSVLSWKLAEAVRQAECRLGTPLGHLLFAVARKPEAPSRD